MQFNKRFFYFLVTRDDVFTAESLSQSWGYTSCSTARLILGQALSIVTGVR